MLVSEYSEGPSFSALVAPQANQSELFRGPTAPAYRPKPVSAIQIGEHAAHYTGRHVAITAPAPHVGNRIDRFA